MDQMIYPIPSLTAVDQRVLKEIDDLGERLRRYLHVPQRWYGPLRRATIARSVRGSVAIEGYHASLDNVTSVLEHDEGVDLAQETRAAIAGYRDAMTFALQVAPDWTHVDLSLIRTLHFMIMRHDLQSLPGNWRPGAVWVRDDDGNIVYTAPDRSELEILLSELVDQLATTKAPAMIKAAMAHLNLVLVHPFRDGNGRVARCLQTFVLGTEGIREPVFSSIEGYLWQDTSGYYAALTEVAAGEWSPRRDPRPWIRFCLTAHYHQARIHLRRIEETELLWGDCESIAAAAGFPQRVVGGLSDAARGRRLQRSLYRRLTLLTTGQEISDPVATRDLAALTRFGLLEPHGQARSRHYRATPRLREVWLNIRARRRESPIGDPYVSFGQQQMPTD